MTFSPPNYAVSSVRTDRRSDLTAATVDTAFNGLDFTVTLKEYQRVAHGTSGTTARREAGLSEQPRTPRMRATSISVPCVAFAAAWETPSSRSRPRYDKAESGMKRPKASVISTGWRPKEAHPVVIEWTL